MTRNTTPTNRREDETADTTESVLLFDMDGVIVEGWGTDDAVHVQALHETLLEYGYDPESDSVAALETFEYTPAFVDACEELGVDPKTFYADREGQSARRAIDRIAAGRRGVYPDTEVLDELAADRPLGLVSNNYNATVEFVVDEFGLDAFSFVRGRDTGLTGFRQRKPDPHYLNEALAALDVTDGLYVGDRNSDLAAAENAGLDGVFIRRSHNAALTLDIEPTHEIESLEQLLELI